MSENNINADEVFIQLKTLEEKTLRDFFFQEKLNTDENPVRRIKKYILH